MCVVGLNHILHTATFFMFHHITAQQMDRGLINKNVYRPTSDANAKR